MTRTGRTSGLLCALVLGAALSGAAAADATPAEQWEATVVRRLRESQMRQADTADIGHSRPVGRVPSALLRESRAPRAAPASTKNLITSLPGFEGTLPFNLYSGYLTVNSTDPSLAGSSYRHLFYMYVESTHEPSTDPVGLWLQGGPGCSGLLGFLLENGPFYPTPSGGLALNPLGWHTRLNMLFIEAPSGVGFSYPDDARDVHLNDTYTSQNNYEALGQFFSLFSELQGRPFYVFGESYAGAYCPQLAHRLVTGPDPNLSAAFGGFMVGNPVFSCPTSFVNIAAAQQGALSFFRTLIPYELYAEFLAAGCDNPKSISAQCNTLANQIATATGNIDPYDLYNNPCTSNSTVGVDPSTPYPSSACVDTMGLTVKYWNRADVQAAIHARVPSGGWTSCAGGSQLQYSTTWPDLRGDYEAVWKAEKRVWVYSGDVDVGVCPAASAQYCLALFNRNDTTAWRQWTIAGQTAGYVRQTDVYTYVTIKGAGHTVPQYQPLSAFTMLDSFLQGKLPSA